MMLRRSDLHERAEWIVGNMRKWLDGNILGVLCGMWGDRHVRVV